MSGLKFNHVGPSPITSGVGIDFETVSSNQDKYAVGRRIFDAAGNEYVRVQAATGGITRGLTLNRPDLATPAVDDDVDAVQAAGTNRLVSAGAFSSFTTGGLEQAWVYINLSTGQGQIRWIGSVIDENTIEVTEPWTGDLAVTSDFIVVRPFRVGINPATATPVSAVARNDASAGEFFWAQVEGTALVQVDAAEDPIVPGDIVTQSLASAGLVEGVTAAGTALADVSGMVGVGIIDTAGGIATPIQLRLSGKM